MPVQVGYGDISKCPLRATSAVPLLPLPGTCTLWQTGVLACYFATRPAVQSTRILKASNGIFWSQVRLDSINLHLIS